MNSLSVCLSVCLCPQFTPERLKLDPQTIYIYIHIYTYTYIYIYLEPVSPGERREHINEATPLSVFKKKA